MAGRRIEIVSRAVEISRHDGNEVAAMLVAKRLAKLDAGDLGHRVPLVGRLRRTFK